MNFSAASKPLLARAPGILRPGARALGGQVIGYGLGAMGRLALIASCLLPLASAPAANIRVYFAQPQSASLDTNAIIATPISTNILADGGVIQQGLPWRITPAANGYATSYFNIGWYALKNTRSGNQVVIAVNDSSQTLYDMTNRLQSGFNTYVAVTYGTNPPPTYNEITNALGFLPVSTNETREVTLNSSLFVGGDLLVRSIAPADTVFAQFNPDGTLNDSIITPSYISGLPTTNTLTTTSNGLITYVNSHSGTATNAIPLLNGSGTNTTLVGGILTNNADQSFYYFRNLIGGLGSSFASSSSGYIGNLAFGTYDSIGQNSTYTTVLGGRSNSAPSSTDNALIIGGSFNYAAYSHGAVVGGQGNRSDGNYAATLGGYSNYVSGDYSAAMGRRASATNHYTFVWTDGFGGGYSTTSNQFTIAALNGLRVLGPINSTNLTATLTTLSNNLVGGTNAAYVRTNDARSLSLAAVQVTGLTITNNGVGDYLRFAGSSDLYYGSTWIADFGSSELHGNWNFSGGTLFSNSFTTPYATTLDTASVSNGLNSKIVIGSNSLAAVTANLTTVSNNYVRTNDTRSLSLAAVRVTDLVITNAGAGDIVRLTGDGSAYWNSTKTIDFGDQQLVGNWSVPSGGRLVSNATPYALTSDTTSTSNGLWSFINTNTPVARALTNANAQVGSDGMARFVRLAVGASATATQNGATASGTSSATGTSSHAEGVSTAAQATGAHSEGNSTIAQAADAHAEGSSTLASGTHSHAEGSITTASGTASHAAGFKAEANAANSYIWGDGSAGYSTNSTANSFKVTAAGGILLDGKTTNNADVSMQSNLNVIGNITNAGLTALFSSTSNGLLAKAITNNAVSAAVGSLLIGANTNAYASTDVLGAYRAGTAAANGTFKKVSATLYTNTETAGWITNGAGTVWTCYNSAGSALYSSATAITNAAWTLIAGSTPALYTVYGQYSSAVGDVILGVVNSTNLDARLALLTANLTTVSNNYVRTNDTRSLTLAAVRVTDLTITNNGAGDIVRLTSDGSAYWNSTKTIDFGGQQLVGNWFVPSGSSLVSNTTAYALTTDITTTSNGLNAKISGGSSAITNNPIQLTYSSTTNVIVNAALGKYFKLVLTNSTTYFPTPTNMTAMQDIVIDIRQDATGGRAVTFTNSWKFPNGQILNFTTNANAWSILSGLVSQYGTNLAVVQTLNFQ